MIESPTHKDTANLKYACLRNLVQCKTASMNAMLTPSPITDKTLIIRAAMRRDGSDIVTREKRLQNFIKIIVDSYTAT